MSTDLNRVTLIGRLTRDAERYETKGGVTITSFSLAVNRSRKQGEAYVDEGHFFDCVIFGRLGEAICQYLTKGKQVGVGGSLSQDRWEQDGQKRSKVKVIAETVQLLGGRGDSEQSAGAGANQSNAAPNAAPNAEDDVPF